MKLDVSIIQYINNIYSQQQLLDTLFLDDIIKLMLTEIKDIKYRKQVEILNNILNTNNIPQNAYERLTKLVLEHITKNKNLYKENIPGLKTNLDVIKDGSAAGLNLLTICIVSHSFSNKPEYKVPNIAKICQVPLYLLLVLVYFSKENVQLEFNF